MTIKTLTVPSNKIDSMDINYDENTIDIKFKTFNFDDGTITVHPPKKYKTDDVFTFEMKITSLINEIDINTIGNYVDECIANQILTPVS